MPIQLNNIPAEGVNTLAIGVFDGLHLGHQALTENADAILTFFPHPVVGLGHVPETEFKYLTLPHEITHYMPNTITYPFSKESSQLSADEFLNDVLLRQINPNHIIVGYDYHFGHNKEGNSDMLKEWGKQHNVRITEVSPVLSKSSSPVKSTTIRDKIKVDFNSGIALLGHSYLIRGTVISGDGRGKSLGYPTVNLEVPFNKLIPQSGVYAGSAHINGKEYRAGIYIGSKPTFGGKQNSIEAHIIEFEENIYGSEVSLFLEQRLRNEMKFDSKDALLAQIKDDLEQITI